MKMKKLVYLMGLALLLNAATDAQAQLPSRLRKTAADKQRKELKAHRPAAPLASQRITPATAEFRYASETTPSKYYRYDAWGNQTEERSGNTHYVKTWDNSHGYPVLLDDYYYMDNPDGTTTEPHYYLRTTLNADGVRTAITDSDGGQYTLDAAGHVTHCRMATTDEPGLREELEVTMKWDGDALTSYKTDYLYEYGDEREEIHIDLTNIRMVHQFKPFNAYTYNCEELLEVGESGLFYDADGTIMITDDSEDDLSGNMQMRSTVSSDKKTAVMTGKLNGFPIGKQTYEVLDDNGSYVLSNESGGDSDEDIYTYNEYGDLIVSHYIENDGVYEEKSVYEWTYEGNRPMQVKKYNVEGNGAQTLSATLTFTAWHDGSSITATEAAAPRVLGATLYTIDGKKVRTLTAEEAQAGEVSAPQRGIYLLVTQTDRGVETRKLIK